MRSETRHTVLLIEADASLRRLIALGLKYRGMPVIEASSPTNLPSLAAQQPSLVILDVDGEAGHTDSSLLATIQSNPQLATLPVVMLAWECALQAQVPCLVKPFDARTLHATIEQMLSVHKVGAAQKVQEGLLITHNTSPAPSMSPLITAAGLLLAFIGFMLNITLAVVGVLVVMVGLLWWTLGPKTKAQPLAVEIGAPYPTSVQ